jgi:hypothetical protein
MFIPDLGSGFFHPGSWIRISDSGVEKAMAPLSQIQILTLRENYCNLSFYLAGFDLLYIQFDKY